MRVTDEMVEAACKGCWPELWPMHFADITRQLVKDNMRAALDAALAVEGTPQVKALEWLESRRPVKTYWAQDERGDLYWINQAFGSDSYYFTTVRRSDGATLYDGDDLGAAKAAAQADYEKRVLSCLEYTTPPAGIREALINLNAELDAMWNMPADQRVQDGQINSVLVQNITNAQIACARALRGQS